MVRARIFTECIGDLSAVCLQSVSGMSAFSEDIEGKKKQFRVEGWNQGIMRPSELLRDHACEFFDTIIADRLQRAGGDPKTEQTLQSTFGKRPLAHCRRAAAKPGLRGTQAFEMGVRQY